MDMSQQLAEARREIAELKQQRAAMEARLYAIDLEVSAALRGEFKTPDQAYLAISKASTLGLE